LRGVRQNNLRGFDLDLPLNRLIVFTGLSGSGKSSLAFDTLFAEGQRRYVETFSPYARQFFDRMDKPQVDAVEGIPPAIAIEQRNTVRSARSTVGTMTELNEYLKQLWPHVAELACRKCGQPVRAEGPAQIGAALPEGRDCWVTFDLELSERLSLAESLSLVARQGYAWLWPESGAVRVEEAAGRVGMGSDRRLTVVQDRLRWGVERRARLAEACEQAYHFGKGRLAARWEQAGQWVVRRFSQQLHCAECDLDYREPTPALFSYNHPSGACPACKGFGRVVRVDYGRALPDRSRTIREGVVRPWQTGMGQECQRDLLRVCRDRGIPVNEPFERLPGQWQRLVIDGDPDYGSDADHEWPRAWYGVKGYFGWLESKAYKLHVRVLLSRYRAYATCPECQGRRFRPESLDFKLRFSGAGAGGTSAERSAMSAGLTLADFQRLTLRAALAVVRRLRAEVSAERGRALAFLLQEVEHRLDYLEEVGLGYLTLDRTTRSLSGGETERVNLTACLGTRLVNTLYVLDEPSVGLHARDTARLVRVLERLRDLGNTVVVVEHEPAVIRAADQVVDLGPGQGEAGGQVMFQGSVAALRRASRSLTGAYLSGRRRIPRGEPRPVCRGAGEWLRLDAVTLHNLRDLSVALPLNRLVCVTGVSGSGKSTLIRDALHPLLLARMRRRSNDPEPTEKIEGTEDEREAESQAARGRLVGGAGLGQVVWVDQSSLGRTPRSNPAVYVGAFDPIRQLFATTEDARQRGLGAGAFSFNSVEGQCPRCRGAGFERIEMQFLSDVFIRCPDCDGRRYRSHVLEVKLGSSAGVSAGGTKRAEGTRRRRAGEEGWTIARMLEATVTEAMSFLARVGGSRADAAVESLRWLKEVGLGYLRLGQPLNTLSGGESQRLKLVEALANAALVRGGEERPSIYLLDEPTTGLHFEDVRVLAGVLRRLVDSGHSVVVVEHNLELIRVADWVIDLGPESGDAGGRVVVEGTPEEVMACDASHTGRALLESALPG
jgi:excinuclease ABC subunit A